MTGAKRFSGIDFFCLQKNFAFLKNMIEKYYQKLSVLCGNLCVLCGYFFTTKDTKALHKVTQRKNQLCVFAFNIKGYISTTNEKSSLVVTK